MNLKRLTQRTFNEQMLRHGYLSEQIPECFSSKSFAEHTKDVIELVKKSTATVPTPISAFKRETSRRLISIPNPYAYACTVKFMGEHWETLRRHAYSENSLSKIVYCRRYNAGLAEALNNERTRLHFKSKSTLMRNAKACMASALGFRYRLKVDISTCYDSINTRSILWAVLGRKTAESFTGKEPPKKHQSAFHFANQMSHSLANQNAKNSCGIITGPYTSRIFSEIVLAGIDAELRERLGKRLFFSFRRYVDDYRFFFKTEAETQRGLELVEEVLDGYGLRLNHAKTSIDVYPFDLSIPIRRRLKDAYDDDGMCGLLNESGRLYNEGHKGAFKYALRMATSHTLDQRDAEVVLAQLFNINLVCPECSKYVVEVVRINRNCFRTDQLSEALSVQLVEDVRRGLDQEAMNSLFFAKFLGLPVPARAVLEVLRTGCDPAIIIALDLWKNHRRLVPATTYETRLVNAARRDLERSLAGASMDGEHWMLLYEAHRHGLLRTVDITNGSTAAFMHALDEMNIDFYRP